MLPVMPQGKTAKNPFGGRIHVLRALPSQIGQIQQTFCARFDSFGGISQFPIGVSSRQYIIAQPAPAQPGRQRSSFPMPLGGYRVAKSVQAELWIHLEVVDGGEKLPTGTDGAG